MAFLERILFPARGKSAQAAQALFDAIVERARKPELYSQAGLPDTLDGRFHAIALYAAIIFPRLETAGVGGKRVSQRLNRKIFDSFDAALRETGVGDASIARKVRSMGEEFFGIGLAVNAAFQSGQPQSELAEVLERNGIVAGAPADRLAAILTADQASTAALPQTQLLAGRTGWR